MAIDGGHRNHHGWSFLLAERNTAKVSKRGFAAGGHLENGLSGGLASHAVPPARFAHKLVKKFPS